MKVYVDADVPDTPAGTEWLARLKSWLEATPEGVTVSMRDAQSELGDVVTTTEAIEFVRTLKVRNPPYNGRSVFYYLVEMLHERLVVLCTRCRRRYGACRCEDRGVNFRDEWYHGGYLVTGNSSAERFWVIERASLRALDLARLPKDHVQLRRERVLAFLNHLKQ